jgi:Aspartyl protease
VKLANLIMTGVIVTGAMLGGKVLPAPIYGVDTRFASGKSALAIPFELDDYHIDNHIFLHVSINGSSPLSFILDTGASHTVLSLRLSVQGKGKKYSA